MRITTKRVVVTALIIALCVGAALPAGAIANAPTPRIRIDGQFVHIPSHDQSPVIVDGRTLVPLRAVMESLGFYVQWQEPTYSPTGELTPGVATLSRQRVGSESLWIWVELNSTKIVYSPYSGAGNRVLEVDVPAKLINSRTMVPVRAIAELTGYTVEWDIHNFIVDIFTNGRIIPQGRPAAASMGNISEWTSGFAPTDLEIAVFNRINAFRSENGLSELPWSNNMAAGAALRTAYLVNEGFERTNVAAGAVHSWGSFTSVELRNSIAGRDGGGMNFSRMSISGTATAEQLADAIVTGWINSPAHHNNMLGQFSPDFMGVGTAVTPDGRTILVYLFMGRN